MSTLIIVKGLEAYSIKHVHHLIVLGGFVLGCLNEISKCTLADSVILEMLLLENNMRAVVLGYTISEKGFHLDQLK